MAAATDETARAVFYDPGSDHWWVFGTAVSVRWVHSPDEVVPTLEEATEASSEGLWSFGYLAYEAAPGFDPKLEVRPTGEPLGWWATCPPPRAVRDDDLPAPGSFVLGSPHATLSAVEHARGVGRIHEAIARGDTYQVNYTHHLEAPFRGSAWGLFRRLWRNQRAPYSAWLENDRQVVCSASPELFFELDGDRLWSRPMKGTAPRGLYTGDDRRVAEALAASPKDSAENIMIVDMIRNDLGRVAKPGSVEVRSLLDVECYPSVFQLTSTVEAETAASVAEIFRALFPCASITGAPKRRTMELIADFEQRPRGLYTGAIGWIAPERRARFSVAIRTAVIDRAASTLKFGTGGGIVWDSRPAAEYQECLDKTVVLTHEPRSFSLVETMRWEPERGYRRLDRHLDRLRDSAGYFDIPLDVAGVTSVLHEASGTWKGPQRVRLTIDLAGTPALEASDFSPRPVPWSLALAGSPVDRGSRWLYHKTTRRETYTAAAAEHPDADDVVLWNDDSELTETTVGNLFLELEDGLWTPPVECGLLAGTMRAQLLDNGTAQERVLGVADLARARAIWVTNSVQGRVPAQLVPGSALTL